MDKGIITNELGNLYRDKSTNRYYFDLLDKDEKPIKFSINLGRITQRHLNYTDQTLLYLTGTLFKLFRIYFQIDLSQYVRINSNDVVNLPRNYILKHHIKKILNYLNRINYRNHISAQVIVEEIDNLAKRFYKFGMIQPEVKVEDFREAVDRLIRLRVEEYQNTEVIPPSFTETES